MKWLLDAFMEKLAVKYDDVSVEYKKTQISFRCRYIYACVSDVGQGRMRLTLSLPARSDSQRAVATVEVRPRRWTHHFLIGSPDEIDEEIMTLVNKAYEFAK